MDRRDDVVSVEARRGQDRGALGSTRQPEGSLMISADERDDKERTARLPP